MTKQEVRKIVRLLLSPDSDNHKLAIAMGCQWQCEREFKHCVREKRIPRKRKGRYSIRKKLYVKRINNILFRLTLATPTGHYKVLLRSNIEMDYVDWVCNLYGTIEFICSELNFIYKLTPDSIVSIK